MSNVKESQSTKVTKDNFKEVFQNLSASNDYKKLDGQRYVSDSGGPIYLVWRNGLKCAIPNQKTYGNLFSSSAPPPTTLPEWAINQIPTGPEISDGALIGAAQGTPWYLVTNGEAWGITQGGVKKYHLNDPAPLSKVVVVALCKGNFTIT